MKSAERSTAHVHSSKLKGSGEGEREKVKMSPGGSVFLSHDAELSFSSHAGVIQLEIEGHGASETPSSSVDLEVCCNKGQSSTRPSHQERIIMWLHHKQRYSSLV